MRPAIVTFLAALGIWAALSVPALRAQDPQASYTPEGAWLMKGTLGPATFVWMDTYTSDSTNQGRSGTVLCTLPSPTSTESGHGVWERIEKNRFAFTAWRIVLDASRQPAGTAKFWGTVTMTSNGAMNGTLSAQYYDLDGHLVNTIAGVKSVGQRIEIQYE